MFAATSLTTDSLDQFTVIAFIFKADGTLKARQVAPGRRTLNAHETNTPRWCSMVPRSNPEIYRRRREPGAARRFRHLVAY